MRVEAVIERWRKRSIVLRERDMSDFQRGLANSYDDLRHEMQDALADQPKAWEPTKGCGAHEFIDGTCSACLAITALALCDHRGDCTHIEATP